MNIRLADNDHREALPITPEQFARDAVLQGLPETSCPYAPGTVNCRLFLREYRALAFAVQAVADGRIAEAEEVLDAANNADAERAEQEFPERFERADTSFDLTDGARPSLWARLCGFVAWMFSKPTIGDKQ